MRFIFRVWHNGTRDWRFEVRQAGGGATLAEGSRTNRKQAQIAAGDAVRRLEKRNRAKWVKA